MKTTTTLFLLLTTSLLFGQEIDMDSLAKAILDTQRAVLDKPENHFFDSLSNGTADYSDKRIMFIADKAGDKVIVDKDYFDKYLETDSDEKRPYTIIALDQDRQDKSGGYKVIVHIPDGGLSDKDFKRLFKELNKRTTEKKQ